MSPWMETSKLMAAQPRRGGHGAKPLPGAGPWSRNQGKSGSRNARGWPTGAALEGRGKGVGCVSSRPAREPIKVAFPEAAMVPWRSSVSSSGPHLLAEPQREETSQGASSWCGHSPQCQPQESHPAPFSPQFTSGRGQGGEKGKRKSDHGFTTLPCSTQLSK